MSQRPYIAVNFYKHHLQFVKNILFLTDKENGNIEPILQQIRSIGNNVLDLYTGNLTAEEIKDDLALKLFHQNITNEIEFNYWLGSAQYKTIVLRDESIWVLRQGIQGEGFVHAHPARTGKNVMRITGSAWKTAFALVLLKKGLPKQCCSLQEKVNYIRTKYLEMSPVKKIVLGSNLEIAIKLLEC